jgi:DNA-binding CsgD family transcriptional regulator
MDTDGQRDLSPPERLALTLMLQRYTAAEIGEALHISEAAARSLIARLAHRLAAGRRESESRLSRRGDGHVTVVADAGRWRN